ncbi:MAG TPA: hypothetical protein VHQ22_21855 [Terriglobales bacterium]|jgi:hypothetical protein|nr:hypothetical protein [Terriglobales bacterium]
MKLVWNVILIITSAASATEPLTAQKIEHETGDRSQITHLRTALNHLTVIELREPVVQVATGSQSFKVEWRENKVFVQPTEADASTNLFVWTSSERLNYELEPAGDVGAMDFAVDQVPRVRTVPTANAGPPPQSTPPTQILLTGKPITLDRGKPSRNSIEVTIRDLYEGDGRVTIRYSVRNRSSRPYEVATPQVYVLSGVHFPQSLYPLVGSQLGEGEASHLRAKEQNPVPVLEGHVQTAHLAPGEESIGIVAVPASSRAEPSIWRFQFGNDERQQVAAFLVR